MDLFVENEFETLKILAETRPELTLDQAFSLEIERKPSNSSRELRLCQKDFQKSLDLDVVERTLFLYEIVHDTRSSLKFLFLILENVEFSLPIEKNFTSMLSNLFSVQCSSEGKTFSGFFVSRKVSEDDRSVIVQCYVKPFDKKRGGSVKIRFTHQETETRYSLNVDLCSVKFPRGSVGLCLPPLTNTLPAFFLQQWLDFHLLIGVEQILIYDENRLYETFFQSYIKRKQVIYYSFPLPQLIIFQRKIETIHQLIAQTHCLMNIRSMFQWIGTWNFDRYLHFFSENRTTFYSNNGRSMLDEFLHENFQDFNSIRLNTLNFLPMVEHSVETNFLVEKFFFRPSNLTIGKNFLIRTDPEVFLVDLTTKFNETTSMRLNVYPIKNSPMRLSHRKSDSILDESLWNVFKLLIEINRQTSVQVVRRALELISIETNLTVQQKSNVEEGNV